MSIRELIPSEVIAIRKFLAIAGVKVLLNMDDVKKVN
jgi:hypothetical protein